MRAGLYIFFLATLLLPLTSAGQQQSADTTARESEKAAHVHSPKKAAWLSVMPGLGQIYNKKYWKVPIIYAALGTTAYFWVDNNKQYKSFREAYSSRLDNDFSNDLMPEYSTEDLRQLKNYYWRYRDMSALIFAGIWALNILDAVVDAHLYTFDISDDLSMRIQPAVSSMPISFGKIPAYGLSLSLTF